MAFGSGWHGMAQRASRASAPDNSRTIQSRTEKRATLERHLAPGSVQQGCQRLARCLGIESLCEIGQSIVSEARANTQLATSRRTDQGLDCMEVPLPQDLSDHQRPEQVLRRDPRAATIIAGTTKVGRKLV